MRSPRLVATALALCSTVLGNPASVDYTDCFSGDAAQKLAVSTVYAQIVGAGQDRHLNFTVLGQSPQVIQRTVNSDISNLSSTLFTSSTVLTLPIFTSSAFFCDSLVPPSPLPARDEKTGYCPLPAGPYAFSTLIPWNVDHALTTINTRIRAVDPLGKEILCLDASTTPLNPGHGSVYGQAHYVFWGSVGLAIAYWAVVGIARVVAAWGRGASRPGPGFWPRVESAGFILASAISGERLATSPALMRFGTPSMRDIIFHTQWCAALAMVAVEWPAFAYPLLSQTAWSTLSYNVTIAQDTFQHWDPLRVALYNPPSNFADQLANSASPIFVDTSVSNMLYTLPQGIPHGIAKFAYTVGLRPQDLWGVSMILFLAIIAGTIVLSVIVWGFDWVASIIRGPSSGSRANGTNGKASGLGSSGKRGCRASVASKDILDEMSPEENRSLNTGFHMLRAAPAKTKKSWWKTHMRSDISTFHGAVLHGNLVRILVLFHLPITIFSSYHMTLPAGPDGISASTTTRALAGLSFAVLSVLLPVFLVFRVSTTTTNKLFDETRTLLSLGPLYNHYRHGSQRFACLLFATNIVFGLTIGCGQKSGTAQAVIILVAEVVSALVTSIWLPWAGGAGMSLISFLFCVARIVVAVLLVILTPTISIGDGAGGWVAYGILVVLALVYLAFILILLVKLIEAALRTTGRVGFDASPHAVDSGILGVLGLLGCCGARPRKTRHPRKNRNSRPSTTAYSNPGATSPYSQSGGSAFSPPTPHFANSQKSGSLMGSMASQGPASVLRPEHAMRPYREESDDESGYIMDAWKPYPSRSEPPPPVVAPPPQKSSGFSRVGGGRSHFETPYAIAAGAQPVDDTDTPSMASTTQFPSFANNNRSPEPSYDYADSTISTVPGQALPRGAMLPAHVRNKSQTAVIENSPVPLVYGNVAPSAWGAKVDKDDDDGDESDGTLPKRKPWYHIRKNRRHSEGSFGGQAEAEAVPEPEPEAAAPPGGSSFVVVRKPQAGGRPPVVT